MSRQYTGMTLTGLPSRHRAGKQRSVTTMMYRERDTYWDRQTPQRPAHERPCPTHTSPTRPMPSHGDTLVPHPPYATGPVTDAYPRPPPSRFTPTDVPQP